MMIKLLCLALAGATGTCVRYWLSSLIQAHVKTQFPLGTAVVNVIGCLLFGFVWAILESRLSFTPQMRTVIFVGFFGAFTTFSSFAFDSSQLLTGGAWSLALANILLQNIVGLAAVLAGLSIGKLI
jgi:fluoride exporter